MSFKNLIMEENNIYSGIPPTFYDKIGDNLIMDLPKLVKCVIARYKLLKDIEYKGEKSNNKTSRFIKPIPELEWINQETINNDIASHFLLAVIMCKNDSDSRWFIKQESLLYKARLEQKYNKYDMIKIFSKFGITLSSFDKRKHRDINISKMKFSRKKKAKEKIYLCHFEEPVYLMPSFEFYIYKDNIYILGNDLLSLFKLVFEKKQEKILEKIKANFDNIIQDDRIKEIILSFNKEKKFLNYNENLMIH